MPYWARTASGGLMNPLSRDDRDMATGLPLLSEPASLMIRHSAGAPLDSTSTNGGSAASLLNSLFANIDPSRGLIDEAALGAKSAADTAYGAMIRNLSRMGINPQSPRFAGTMRKWAANRMATEAAARNEAARAGQGDAFRNRFSLWSALNSNDEAESNRNFQAGQADASRAFSANQTNQARSWALSDRDAAAAAQDAENRSYMNVLDQYLNGRTAATNTAAPSTQGSNGWTRTRIGGMVGLSGGSSNPSATTPRPSGGSEGLQLIGLFGGAARPTPSAVNPNSPVDDGSFFRTANNRANLLSLTDQLGGPRKRR